ncbi:nuclear apoptosis-inducing factor 1-like [Sebastes fasciatus]|uniref:nuclear apoptosis-inducing factor 1-like n=1 Tax=Sebastes fasciatus TaxID=394691 RepID=UPI003D9EA491
MAKWQHVAAAVNSVSATDRKVPEIKKKWSDLKVEAKKNTTIRTCLLLAGGTPKLTPLETRMASILGEASVWGIVSEKEGDTDMTETTDEPVLPESGAVGDEEVPGEEVPGEGAAAAERPTVPSTSASSAHGTPGSGRVLTDAVLQT